MRLLLLILLLPLLAHADPRWKAPLVSSVSYTHSMEPHYHGGERVLILPRRITHIHVGQIALYYDARRHLNIIHRVIMVYKTPLGYWMICQGDGNDQPDYYAVSGAQLIGVAAWQLWPMRWGP